MTNIPRNIHEAYISTRGNPAAGIAGKGAWLRADSDYLVDLGVPDAEDRRTLLEEFREALVAAFGKQWGEAPKVVFDFELGE